MATNPDDILRIVTPKAPPDPLAIKTPPAGDPLAIVESMELEADKDSRPSLLEILNRTRDAVAEQTALNTLKGLGVDEGAQKFDAALQGIGAATLGGVESGLESLRTGGGVGDRGQRKLLANVVETGVQIPSSLAEQIGTIYSHLSGRDEENNMLFQFGRNLREATRTPDAELANNNIADDFGKALVQTGSFLIGGKAASEVLGKGTKTAGAIAAWLGSAVGGQMGREDAIAHGAEDWQVDLSYYLNSTFGLSEGLPLGMALGRLDDLAGGVISSKLKSEAGKVAKQAIRGGVEEALQETFQTFGENLTAADLAAYDPSRSLSDNLVHAAGIGGSVGLLVNLLMAGMGAKNRAARRQKLKEDVLDPLGIESLDEIGGAFVRLDDGYLKLQSELIKTQQVIEGQAETSLESAEKFLETVDIAEDRIGAPLRGVLFSSRNIMTTEEQAETTPASRRVMENLVLSKELEGDTTVVERLKQTPIVMAFNRAGAEAEIFLPSFKEKLKQLEETGVTPLKSRATPEALKERIAVLEAIVKEEQQLAKSLKSLTSILRPMFGKGTKFVVNDQYIPNTDSRGQGSFNLTEINGEVVNFINLSVDDLMNAVRFQTQSPSDTGAARVRAKRAEVIATYLHEMGHGIAFDRFQNLIRKVMEGNGTPKEVTLAKALSNDYMQFVTKNLLNKTDVVMGNYFSLPRAKRMLEAWNVPTTGEDLSTVPGDIDAIRNNPIEPNTNFYDIHTSKTLEYFFSPMEYFAEEFSKYAQEGKAGINPQTLPYIEDVFDEIQGILKEARGKFRTSSPTMEAYFKNHSIRAQIKSAGKQLNEKVETNPLMALASEGLLDSKTGKSLTEENDVFNKFMDVGFNILQIAEQNPHIQGLQNYVRHLRSWKNEVNTNLAIAEDRLTEWKNLGQEENEKLSRLLLDETVGRKPDGGWLAEPRPFTVEEIASYGLSDEALQLRSKIKEDFRRSLQEMEDVLVAAKQRLFKDDPALQTKEINKVRKEFKDMKARPYFPLMRFGEYVYQVYAVGDQRIDGRDYKDGAVVDWQTFDTKRERDAAEKRARASFVKSKVNISSSKLVVPNFSLQGMPLTLLEHLESKLVSAGINDEVRQAIAQVKNDVLPFKSFRKQFQRRKRVAGYSMDTQRAYANYMTSFSNHIARVKFDSEFKKDFENIENSIKVANRKGDADTTKRAEILNHMNEHLQYVMNPVNEFVGLRSAAFFWFLGFNVKSAFVNLTQIPLVTYPYLGARFGDGRAVAQISRAYGTATQAFVDPKKLHPELASMIEQGLAESWLDESLATELALAASEKNLDKSLPRKFRQQLWLKTSHYGSLPFHAAEKFNRHITAIAAYRLARADGKGHESGVEEARRAVEKTQFEYARWARPRFQRGKVGGTVFVFQNYMQNALYFALGGDPGALRMIMMLFLVAGLQGLPFGENIMDLVDAGMKALKKRTGASDPHSQVRVDLRKFLKDLEINPDLVLHGISSSTFGLANVGEFMGWPIPDIDLSGSLSMGRIIPGTELLQAGQGATFERTLANASERAGGAIVSGMSGIGRAIFDNHPDQWKRWEKAMPAAMRSVSKAARYSVRGEEATRSGYPIAGFDEHDPRDRAELIAQSLGFTPRDVSRGWEGFIAQQQAVIYYETWKSSLLRQWNYHKDKGDEEAVKAANAAIREYNSIVPFPEMKIGPDTRRQSYKTYLNTRKFNEARIEQSKPFRRLSDSIQAVFAEGDNEDNE